MQVTKSEKMWLGVLVAVAFGMGNYLGYGWLAKKQSSLQLTEAELRADQDEAKVDLLESGQWAQLQAWIRDHEPVLGDEGESKAAVLNYVVKGARDNKLEVADEEIGNNVQHGAAGTRITVSIKVKGSMQGLCKWLTDLQKPDQFYAVSSFSLKADEDQKSMDCALQIARYFKEGS